MTFDVGEGVACDLDRLIAGRLLVQASSGQGKTWAIRRLLEQTHGHVQHLVIDPEGEYFTLREKFDYVHAAAKGGDVVAHPRYAALLATELLKLGASAILDIYELNPQDRKAFVKHFCTALVNAPRDLWHPCLIVLDEAHVFCPEKDQAESAEAVKALASRGRKRAFCLVMATQRLSKLAKDAAAEMGNKLIGGCRLDIDVKRAAEELGFTDVAQRQAIRQLKPGRFFASGAAFGTAGSVYSLFQVGNVKTTHPEPGQAAAPTPPATEKVRAVLKRLEALPAEAEEREKSIETLSNENTALRVELRLLKAVRTVDKPAVEYKETRVEVPVVLDSTAAKLKEVATAVHAEVDRLAAFFWQISSDLSLETSVLCEAVSKVGAGGDLARGGGRPDSLTARSFRTSPSAPNTVGGRGAPPSAATRPASGTARGHHTPTATFLTPPDDLDGAQQKILDTALMLERRGLTPNRVMLARWMGIHPNGGRYGTNLARLKEWGLLNGAALTDQGRAHARNGVTTGLEELRAVVDEPTWKIVTVLYDTMAKQPHTRETLADALGIHPNGGRYGTNLARLREMGVIPERGHIHLTAAAFE